MAELSDVLKALCENPGNTVTRQEIIGIRHSGECVVTLYPTDKYAEFAGEFTQTASSNPELQPLIHYLDEQGYHTNLT